MTHCCYFVHCGAERTSSHSFPSNPAVRAKWMQFINERPVNLAILEFDVDGSAVMEEDYMRFTFFG